MSLKSQDILVALKLVAIGNRMWTYSFLSSHLFISISEVHATVRRAVRSHLLNPDGNVPIIQSVTEYLVFGIRYSFPPFLGELTHGTPTGYGAPPLTYMFENGDEPPPVWKDGQGEVFGYECSPIYPTASDAACLDSNLYELLTLVDAIRIGAPRERALAGNILVKRLRSSRSYNGRF